MKAKNHEARGSQGWVAQAIDRTRTTVGRRCGFLLLFAMMIWIACGTSYGQTLKGSPGAGWQTWTAALDSNFVGIDLNDNYHPYWDSPWGASGSYGGGLAEKNVGFCLTSTGDCQGIGSALLAPGALPFWGMPYDSVHDTGGARDNTVYFERTDGGRLKATLYLNMSANPSEINEFGWFETDSTGSTVKSRHTLFQGSGEPTGTLTPDPVGKSVTFTPSQYFGYYYSDVSEPTGTPEHGCYAYTIFTLDEPRCIEASGGQGDHDFVVFKGPGSHNPTYWIVGEDPTDCTSQDGDCNLTVVTVTPVTSHGSN